jgi:hypothetical protein
LVSVFLVAFLVSLIFPILYLYSFYYLLVTEIVPQDQKHIPKPKVGDKISVYGVWVQDNELKFLVGIGWNEIHPVRYAEINDAKYGSINHNGSLFDGVEHLDKFVLLDKKNPYRTANGTVMDVFTNPDDRDYHVHILVDENYRDLVRVKFVLFPYADLLRIMSVILPISIAIIYLIVSITKPRHTIAGRYILRLKRERLSK